MDHFAKSQNLLLTNFLCRGKVYTLSSGLNKIIMKQYINPLLRAGSLAMLLYLVYSQHNTINTLNTKLTTTDSLTHVCDSLQSEILTKDIDLGRYEIIFNRAEGEMSPECKTELESIRQTVE